MSFDLRPLSISELLDRSVSIYRRHFLLCVGIMAVPSALLLVVLLPIEALNLVVGPNDDPEDISLRQIGAVVAMFGGLIVGMLLYFCAYLLALGATSIAVAELYRGVVPTIAECYRRVRSEALPLIVLGLHIMLRIALAWAGPISLGFGLSVLLATQLGGFSILFTFAGMLLAFVWCVVLALRYSLSVPVLVLEKLPARAALKRSAQLARGNMGRVFLVVFCATLITYASALLFQGPFIVGAVLAGQESTTGVLLNLAGTVVGTIGTTLVAPVMIVGLAVLYYDVRVRGEALDMELMLANAARADLDARDALSPAPTAQ